MKNRLIILFTFINSAFFGQSINKIDSTIVLNTNIESSNPAKLFIYRPYLFEASLVNFSIEIKDIKTNITTVYKLKNASTIEILIENSEDIEITIFENNKHYYQNIILRPGDKFYFKLELRKHLPIIKRISPEQGEKEYIELKQKSQ